MAFRMLWNDEGTRRQVIHRKQLNSRLIMTCISLQAPQLKYYHDRDKCVLVMFAHCQCNSLLRMFVKVQLRTAAEYHWRRAVLVTLAVNPSIYSSYSLFESVFHQVEF